MKKIAVLLCLGMVSGCGPILSATTNSSVTEDSVLADTAKYFGANPKEIKISNYNKGMLGTGYQATYKGTLYNCTIYYGNLTCKKPGE